MARLLRHVRLVPLSEVAAPIRLFRPSGRTRWDGSRLITDRAAFWCATPHRMVSETEELDRWSPQSHRPSLADQNLSYNSQPWGLALLTKASMFQPLLPFDCWATVLSGRPRNHLAGRLSPACPIAPDPDACGRCMPFRENLAAWTSARHRRAVFHHPAARSATGPW